LTSHSIALTDELQRTSEVGEQYKNLGSRIAHLGAVTGALNKRSHLDPNLLQRLENIAECVTHLIQNLLLIRHEYRSFSMLTACIEAKQARGTVRRVLESQADITEIKDILVKISARIEAFLVSELPLIIIDGC